MQKGVNELGPPQGIAQRLLAGSLDASARPGEELRSGRTHGASRGSVRLQFARRLGELELMGKLRSPKVFPRPPFEGVGWWGAGLSGVHLGGSLTKLSAGRPVELMGHARAPSACPRRSRNRWHEVCSSKRHERSDRQRDLAGLDSGHRACKLFTALARARRIRTGVDA